MKRLKNKHSMEGIKDGDSRKISYLIPSTSLLWTRLHGCLGHCSLAVKRQLIKERVSWGDSLRRWVHDHSGRGHSRRQAGTRAAAESHIHMQDTDRVLDGNGVDLEAPVAHFLQQRHTPLQFHQLRTKPLNYEPKGTIHIQTTTKKMF